MIPFIVPFQPPIEDYLLYLNEIWNSGGRFTNNGPLVNELETRLSRYLGVRLSLVTNGTMALQLAIASLGLTGEVITTPFSYVATTSSLVWQNCRPVMVDVLPGSWNIDPSRIEEAITFKTSGILATHLYGNPCDVDAIAKIASDHALKVIYDAAHAFGSTYKGRSLLSFGDASIVSFHCTKVFHTVEGGAVISDPETLRGVALRRNFGLSSPYDVAAVGINGKLSELHAAMGLCNLKYIDEVLRVRKLLSDRYDYHLAGLVVKPQIAEGCTYNYAYYPVLFNSSLEVDEVTDLLERNGITARRFPYPSLSTVPYLNERPLTPVCDGISSRLLCLPLYHALSLSDVDEICDLIVGTMMDADTMEEKR